MQFFDTEPILIGGRRWTNLPRSSMEGLPRDWWIEPDKVWVFTNAAIHAECQFTLFNCVDGVAVTQEVVANWSLHVAPDGVGFARTPRIYGSEIVEEKWRHRGFILETYTMKPNPLGESPDMWRRLEEVVARIDPDPWHHKVFKEILELPRDEGWIVAGFDGPGEIVVV